MLIYKGGEIAEAGTYINPTDGSRAKISTGQRLPGDKAATFLKLSHCVALTVLVAAGAAMSAALPFGIGVLMMVFALAAVGAIGAVVVFTMRLTSEVFGRNATFGWAPSAAYLAGKKTQKGKKDEEAKKDEADKHEEDK